MVDKNQIPSKDEVMWERINNLESRIISLEATICSQKPLDKSCGCGDPGDCSEQH